MYQKNILATKKAGLVIAAAICLQAAGVSAAVISNLQIKSSAITDTSVSAGAQIVAPSEPATETLSGSASGLNVQITAPTVVDKLDPQPEPPDQDTADISVPRTVTIDQLNPQPEPPAPAGAVDIQVTTRVSKPAEKQESVQGAGSVQIQNPVVQDKLQNAQNANKLNPQPEPPMPEGGQTQVMVLKRGNNAAQPMKFQFNPLANATSTIGATDLVPSEKSIEARFKHGEREITVPIRADVKVENEKLVLTENGQMVTVKVTPAIFYKQWEAALGQKLASKGVIKNAVLEIRNGKPVYNTTINEPVKLFGLIPVTVGTRAVIGADDNKVQEVKRPWYGFVFSASKIKDMELKPNLRVESITFEPEYVTKDQPVKVKYRIANDGMAYALDLTDIINGGGPTASIHVKGSYYTWYHLFIALAPGESVEYSFGVSKAVCGADTIIEVKSQMDEATKEDNQLMSIMKCQ